MTTDRKVLEADFRRFMSGACACPSCRVNITPSSRTNFTDAQRAAMLEGAPSWMPNEPKGEASC